MPAATRSSTVGRVASQVVDAVLVHLAGEAFLRLDNFSGIAAEPRLEDRVEVFEGSAATQVVVEG